MKITLEVSYTELVAMEVGLGWLLGRVLDSRKLPCTDEEAEAFLKALACVSSLKLRLKNLAEELNPERKNG